MANLYLINKTKFGFKNNSRTYRDDMISYFKEFFIPYIKNNYQQGDMLIHTGGLFNTTNINIVTESSVIEIFDELSEIIPTIFLLSKKDLDPTTIDKRNINTFNIFRHNKKIKIITEDFKLNNEIILVPWERDKDFLNYLRYDVVISNNNLNHYMDVLNKESVYINGYQDVNLKEDNFIDLGSPYQLNKEDNISKKGFTIYNTKTKHVQIIENLTSRKYFKFKINEIEDFELFFRNVNIELDVVDLEINRKLIDEQGIVLEKYIYDYKVHSVVYFTENVENIEQIYKHYNNIELQNILDDYITEMDDEYVSKEYKKILNIFKQEKSNS